MRYKRWILVLGILLLLCLERNASGYFQEDDGHLLANLKPTWTTGIISDAVGPSNIVVTDLTKDGVTDIVACSKESAYVLNETAGGYYDTTWYSEKLLCSKVAASDRDNDDIHEIYIGTSNSKVHIFRSDNFKKVGEISLLGDPGIAPGASSVTDIGLADVDHDGSIEIVVVRADATFVYDAKTLAIEWQATGKGGNRLGLGDIDGDSEIEIVVNDNPAHILNAVLKTEEWAYSGGFGIDMAVGDVDGDNIAEIAYIEDWDNAYVFEADTQTTKWHLNDLDDLSTIIVADTDGDGVSEVLIGDDQWGDVTGYRGNDGTKLWGIPNPEHGVDGIGVGDADNDSVNEVVWGAGITSSGKDALFVGDWGSEIVEWSSDDLDGPLHVAAGDVDNDGQMEIVLASRSTTSSYDGGTIRVYDGVTHQLEWSTVESSSKFYRIAVGQLDTDPALEIVLGGEKYSDTRLWVYDGVTHVMEWESAELSSGVPGALLVMNLDNDPVEEIVVGLSNSHVLVFNGVSSVIQWDSGSLDGSVRDLDIRDLDGNMVLDMAVLTDQSVYIIDLGTWTQKLHHALNETNKLAFNYGDKLVITNGDMVGAGELLISISSESPGSQIQAWDGENLELLWQRSLENINTKDIAAADLDGDGDEEFVIMGDIGSDWDSNHDPSLLLIGSQIFSPYWTEYQNDGYWGMINGMIFADVDSDGQKELVFGSDSLIQVNEIISSPLIIINLPIVVRSQ